MDINPITEGHTLVVLKDHYPNLLEVPEELVKGLFVSVKRVAEMVKSKMNSDGLNIGTNNGRAANQIVFHVHVHIIPRKNGDNISFRNRRGATREELQALHRKLISHL